MKNETNRYRFASPLGMFSIELTRAGLWRLRFGRREVRIFDTAESALDALLRDPTIWTGAPRSAELGLPVNLEDWASSKKKSR